MEPHLARADQTERLALTLQTESSADVGALIRMTSEWPTEAPTITADLLAARFGVLQFGLRSIQPDNREEDLLSVYRLLPYIYSG